MLAQPRGHAVDSPAVSRTVTRERDDVLDVQTRGPLPMDDDVAWSVIRQVRVDIDLPSALPRTAAVAPEPPTQWPRLFTDAWVIPAALLGLTLLLRAAQRFAGRPVVVAAYAPPAALRAGEAGVVIDGHVHTRDLVAAVVELAVRGILALERGPGAGGHDVIVSIQRPWLHDRDLRPFEVVLLAHVFTDPGFRTVRLSELRGTGYGPESIKDTLSADLADHGLFAAPPRAVRQAGWWLALIVLAVWTQVAWNAQAETTTYVAGVAAAAATWLFMAVVAGGGLTRDGRHARNQLLGFREYLERVDKDRLEKLEPGALDPHLPWAIALDVTESWLAPTAPR